MISSQREDLFTIQLGSLEPIVIPLMVKIMMIDTSLISNGDEEGWTIVT